MNPTAELVLQRITETYRGEGMRRRRKNNNGRRDRSGETAGREPKWHSRWQVQCQRRKDRTEACLPGTNQVTGMQNEAAQ